MLAVAEVAASAAEAAADFTVAASVVAAACTPDAAAPEGFMAAAVAMLDVYTPHIR
jgi:hypothetical protein